MPTPISPADPRTSLANAPRVTFAVETHAEVQLADEALSALLALDSPDFDAFRILRTKLKTLGDERPLRSFGVVSALPQEGTTSVALGLALALTQEHDRRVLLVETTLRAPGLARKLGLAVEPGLGEWLASGGDRQGQVTRRVPVERTLSGDHSGQVTQERQTLEPPLIPAHIDPRKVTPIDLPVATTGMKVRIGRSLARPSR